MSSVRGNRGFTSCYFGTLAALVQIQMCHAAWAWDNLLLGHVADMWQPCTHTLLLHGESPTAKLLSTRAGHSADF